MAAMNSPLQNFPSAPLIPVIAPNRTVELAVNLAPSTVFPKGTVLGLITNAAADVQTTTITGSPTGGTFTLSGTNPLTNTAFTTTGLAYNAAAATVQTALVAAFGTGNVTVTGSAGGPYTITFAGSLVNMPIQVMVASGAALTGGTSPAAANVHTTIGRTAGTYAAYNSGNSDGTQTAKCILKFDCATDAWGNITYGLVSGGGEWGQTTIDTPAYFAGYFQTSQLVGLDSGAVTNLGKLIQGTTSTGILDVN